MTSTTRPRNDLDTPRQGHPAQAVDQRELALSIIARIGAAMREIRAHASDELLKAGVSISHLQVIWQLERHGGELPMGRLADLLGISVSNATGLIDRMAERGLVERVRPTGDRRSVHVRPTAAGIRTAEAMELMRIETTEAVLDRLDQEQLERLTAGLAEWIDAFEAVVRERAVPHATPSRPA